MSIARAVIEHIANRKKLGAKTLFATHYHELTELEQSFFNIKTITLPSRKTVMRSISCGGLSAGELMTATASMFPACRNSGGDYPRAQQILKQLESGNMPSVKAKKQKQPEPMVLVQQDDSELVRRLKEIDIEKITPVQALVLLSELKARI